MPRFRKPRSSSPSFRQHMKMRYNEPNFPRRRSRRNKRRKLFVGWVIVAIFVAAGVWAYLEFGRSGPTSEVPDSSTPTVEAQDRYPGGVPLDPRAIELAVIKYTNERRMQKGLNPLQEKDVLTRIARAHSENMIRLGYEHDLEGKGPTERAIAAGFNCTWAGGYYGLGENIYMYNRVSWWRGNKAVSYKKDADEMAQSLVKGWMVSPGHRENILDRAYRLIGVGIAIEEIEEGRYIDEVVYATQNFSGCSP